MTDKRRGEFELLVLPHLGAAYSLARWLMRSPQDADDAVQDSMLRAFRGFGSYAGGDSAAWVLAIVRNTCLTKLERRRAESNIVVLQDVVETLEATRHSSVQPPAPQDQAMIAEEERKSVRAAIAVLPLQFREVLVLREFHDLSYREIADIVGTPVGTVMSRLGRAREKLKAQLMKDADAESGKAS